MLLILLAVLLTGACGGDDGPSAVAEGSSESAASAKAPRLDCNGPISSFVVTGPIEGATIPSHATAGDAVQAEVDSQLSGSAHRFVGDDPAGSRYAVVDQAGGVTAEIVVHKTTKGWETAQIDQCEGGATDLIRSDETQQFCAAMTEFSSGAITDLDGVAALVEEIASSAPEQIRSDAEEFARLGLVVSTAFHDAGVAEDVDIDIEPILDDLPPDARQFVFDLANGAQGESALDTVVGRVFNAFVIQCAG